MDTITINENSSRAQLTSDMVLMNGWAMTAAIGPIDLENDRKALPEGVEAQTRKVLSNLETILKQSGLTREDVAAVRVYLVEAPRLLERFNAAYAGFFPAGRLPARSVVGATYLTRGAQVEMDFILKAPG